MRIVLLGYMASGKSTAGNLLAERLSLDFIDLDGFIEEKAGKTVAEIFELEGEKSFRKKEKESLEILLAKDNIVIAAGGGTPCFFENMQWISDKALSVYLKTEAEELYQRLSEQKIRKKRPLLKGHRNLLDFIRKSLSEREPFYLKADLVIEVGGKKVKEIVEEIILKLKKTS